MFGPMLRVITLFVLLAFTGNNAIASNIETLGDVFQILNPSLALHSSYKNFGHAGLKSCAKGIVANIAATQALKITIDANRPNGGSHGFPSGHTSTAASGFGCILGEEGLSPKAIAVGLSAAITGYTRVKSNKHTWAQVGAGFLLGGFLGYRATREIGRNNKMSFGISSHGEHILTWSLKF